MIFSRRKKRDREAGHAEAEAALKTSVDDLHAAVVDRIEISKAAQRSRSIRQRNHFAEAIRHAYRGEPA